MGENLRCIHRLDVGAAGQNERRARHHKTVAGLQQARRHALHAQPAFASSHNVEFQFDGLKA